MYQLDFPWLLLLLPVPLLAWWLIPPHREASASIRLPFFDQVARAAGIEPTEGSVIPKRSWPQTIMEGIAWCLIVLALARPQFVEPPLEKLEPQRDILLALDLSQSMETRDFAAPDGTILTRLDAVRTVVSDFVSKRSKDRLGLIAIGDAPYPLAPFTMDHPLVQTLVEGLVPGIAGPRTALGDSLGLAVRMFEKTSVPQKVLILLTDGNDTASKMPPLKAAEIAKGKGIVIHAIGIGDPSATGEDKLDTATLQKIATETGGRYFFGGGQTALAAIYEEIDRITPEDQKSLSWRPRRELFYWPLGASIVVLTVWYGFIGLSCLLNRRRSA
ncbi:VWA domain-containing protein [Rhizobium sp. BK376]|jgi:Ca-activated chloride channel family protein|uniref:vWA domain-containing protein n=1 Tax=Rhizobium sp. BK376 TaxID=2512149 RepID=UPI001050B089|nr:VWA domain-containing protein [Rhizobium sp. BK376]TCR85455.1 Ca-activated chloride channel family protein [Rhizobium sp. BK376]